MQVAFNVLKSLYRIRNELTEEGIFVMPDYLYHLARRKGFRLRIVKETYEREVYGVDAEDAERLKAIIRSKFKGSSGPSTQAGAEEESDKRKKTSD